MVVALWRLNNNSQLYTYVHIYLLILFVKTYFPLFYASSLILFILVLSFALIYKYP